MWFEIICGLVICSLYKLFFSDGDDVLDVETSDSTTLFAVTDMLSKLYNEAKVYVGLRIPDVDTSSPQPIDLNLLNRREAVVIAVKNLSRFISVKPDGNWVFESLSKHKADHHPDHGPKFEPPRILIVLFDCNMLYGNDTITLDLWQLNCHVST